jgi:hypothetical protein
MFVGLMTLQIIFSCVALITMGTCVLSTVGVVYLFVGRQVLSSLEESVTTFTDIFRLTMGFLVAAAWSISH